MPSPSTLNWLLQGDVSIQYQTYRDLLNENRCDLRERIATEGWGAQFMAQRQANGHWGKAFYNPKWTSTHYTLLDLCNLGIAPDLQEIQASIALILQLEKGRGGGINPSGAQSVSDVCINGMFLNYAAYFQTDARELEPVVDFLLTQIVPDGGFNCRHNRSKVVHSSLHTTLSVLEGIHSYTEQGYQYRLPELQAAQHSSREFILLHQLFRSDHTGNIINSNFLKLCYPGRWKYDILRALDHFQSAETPKDERMRPAIEVLLQKRNPNGTWNLAAKHPGQLHFDMEQAGKPSRWNTLRALRVLKHFDLDT